MAINCYTGLMGSGKTYEVVENVIIPNYMKGRRIVTNINGLNEEKLKEYILKKNKNFNEENFGSIILCSDEQAMKEDFFPQDDITIESFVKRGDFVVIDEAWKQWGSSTKLLPQHLLFFTKHRHFTNEKGVSCDLAIIVQDISILNRTLKSLIEMIFRTKKLKSLGISTAYTLQVYDGHRLTKQFLINTITRKYNKDIFPLYKSYANGEGKELQIDKRTSIFSAKFFIIIIIMIVVAFFSLRFVYNYFSTSSIKADIDKVSIENKTENQKNNVEINDNNKQNQVVKNSVDFRLVGVLDTPSRRLIIIENKNDGSIKMVAPNLCKGVGISLNCVFDNQEINYYSNLNKQNNNSFFGGTQNEKNNLSSNN